MTCIDALVLRLHECKGAMNGETEITAVPLSRFRHTREACAGLRAGTA